jgi:hypothetical protein
MVLRYYGVAWSPDGGVTGPASLNEFFRQGESCRDGVCASKGYFSGNVVWAAADEYTRLANTRFGTPIVEFGEFTSPHDAEVLSSNLRDGRPVIVAEPGHFVVATGVVGDTFTINDPLFTRTRLDDAAYNNTSQGFRLYAPTNTDLSSLTLMALAPAQLSVTGPGGARTGVGSGTGITLEEIPRSTYVFEEALADDLEELPPPPASAGVHVLLIQDPTAGEYQVEIIAEPGARYAVAAYGNDRDGSTTLGLFTGVQQLSREVITLRYSRGMT